MADYILMTNSNSSLSKKFYVVPEGFNEMLKKKYTAAETIDGGLDVTVGQVYDRRYYTVRVRQAEDEEGFGDLEDLKTFYSYNDPNGTPSNLITFRDHYYGVDTSEMYIWLLGDFSKSIIGNAVIGGNAYALVKLEVWVQPS